VKAPAAETLRSVVLAAAFAALGWSALRGARAVDAEPRSSRETATPAAGSVRRLNAYPSVLPDGPGKDRVASRCTKCHGAMLIAQQRKDAAGWDKTLATMEAWSDPADTAGRAEVRAYLVSRFGPAGGGAPRGTK
jgi:cytochrome c5